MNQPRESNLLGNLRLAYAQLNALQREIYELKEEKKKEGTLMEFQQSALQTTTDLLKTILEDNRSFHIESKKFQNSVELKLDQLHEKVDKLSGDVSQLKVSLLPRHNSEPEPRFPRHPTYYQSNNKPTEKQRAARSGIYS
jgi:hypothetical protein